MVTTDQSTAANQRSRLSDSKPTTVSNSPAGEKQPLAFSATFAEMALINFQIDPKLVRKKLPPGLECDSYNGDSHVSLVAKAISDLRWKGIPVCRKFCSLSLQLYVKQETSTGPKYGTFFLKNYVSRSGAAWLMGKLLGSEVDRLRIVQKASGFRLRTETPDVEYAWKVEDRENKIRIRARSRIKQIPSGSKASYVLRHSDRYTLQNGKTYLHGLSSADWQMWDVAQANFTCDVKHLFGEEFVKPLAKRPASVLLSKGSDVRIQKPVQIS
jgi:uncharacterized protein YqjF (DUF2071 family)